MKDAYIYEIPKRKKDYRFEIVSSGVTNLFFNTSFSEDEKGVITCYAETKGFKPLKTYVEMPGWTIVEIIRLVLKEVWRAMDRFMLPWDYIITPGTVFTNRNADAIKMIYLPTFEQLTPEEKNIYISLKKLALMLEKQIVVSEQKIIREIVKILNPYMGVEECYRMLVNMRDDLLRELDL